MAQLPDRHRIIGGGLIDIGVAIQRAGQRLAVDLRLGGEAVETAAPHEQHLVDEYVARRAQLALIAGLAQDAGRGIAAAVAEAGKIDLDECEAILKKTAGKMYDPDLINVFVDRHLGAIYREDYDDQPYEDGHEATGTT